MSDREKDPAAVSLGRRGGFKGGPARAAVLTPEQRSDIARRAAMVRWETHREISDAEALAILAKLRGT